MTLRINAAWDDAQGNVQAAAGVSSLTVEQYRDTGFLMPHFQHNQDDKLHLTFQFTHRKKLGSVLASLHIHCIPLADPASDEVVEFSVTWYWANTVGHTVPALTGWTVTPGLMTVSPGDVYETNLFTMVSDLTPPAGEQYSSMLLATVARLGSSGASDSYTTNKVGGTVAANLALLYIDAHFLTDRRGSQTEAAD